jgi:8-amino-7-oxononanoate synthase
VSRLDDWLADQVRRREEAGLTRRLVATGRDPQTIDLAGNDYLGLSRDPRVVEGAVRAARDFGSGAGASRLVTGTQRIHADLEDALAAFTGAPTALVLSTGYHANLSVVAALADEDTLVVSDAHIHASMVDACRLSRGRIQVVPHSDLAAVESALAQRPEHRALVVAESIYSVLGDAAPVSELAALCETYDATLVLDEAHALGVAGPGGRGLAHAAGLSAAPHVVVTVTLSKALGAQGGAVLGSSAVREHLINRARPFIYDTGLAPASAGAALAALAVTEASPDLVARCGQVAFRLADAAGVDVPAGAVLSVSMPGPREALEAVAVAAKQDVLIGCFRPPSTPDGVSRLRLTAHADIDDAELEHACVVIGGVVSEVSGRG